MNYISKASSVLKIKLQFSRIGNLLHRNAREEKGHRAVRPSVPVFPRFMTGRCLLGYGLRHQLIKNQEMRVQYVKQNTQNIQSLSFLCIVKYFLGLR